MKKVIFFLFIIYSSFVSAVTEDLVIVFGQVILACKEELKNGRTVDYVLENCGAYIKDNRGLDLKLYKSNRGGRDIIDVAVMNDKFIYACSGEIDDSLLLSSTFTIRYVKTSKTTHDKTLKMFEIDIEGAELSTPTLVYKETVLSEAQNADPQDLVGEPPSISTETDGIVMQDGENAFIELITQFRNKLKSTQAMPEGIPEEEVLVMVNKLLLDIFTKYAVSGSRTANGHYVLILKIQSPTTDTIYFRCFTKNFTDTSNPRCTIVIEQGSGKRNVKFPKLNHRFSDDA